MHAHLEDTTRSRADTDIQALSWMGKVPDSLPEDGGGWRLNRQHYYQEGWLATATTRGTIGVTFTVCHCKKNFELPPRINFNLRGHRHQVMLVRWNEPYQKLATCDRSGVIFVWIKHEGRWSIELINDRNSQVRDFAWSHDGRMALIAYQDGFVLVGSVAGQRYWSSLLNLDECSLTCAAWSPDDQRVMLGTSRGKLVVLSSTGTVLAELSLGLPLNVNQLCWSCQKFYLDESDPDVDQEPKAQSYLLAVAFAGGRINLLSSFDDASPTELDTRLDEGRCEWSNDGTVLAVAGSCTSAGGVRNVVRLYARDGVCRYRLDLPDTGKAVAALTWGHNDKRLFVAAGPYVHTVWVSKKVTSLQLAARLVVQRRLSHPRHTQLLPLPSKLKSCVSSLFTPTIKGYVPDPMRIRQFVCRPPTGRDRVYCTMIQHGEETANLRYTLYLEYLGGLIPLLRGRRASKLRAGFQIFDPKIRNANVSPATSDTASSSDSDIADDGCASPRMQRRRNRSHAQRRPRRDAEARPLDHVLYDYNMPESHRLAEVTSNILGTRFRIHGVSSFLPTELGFISYKTSLLHLQPRQMTVRLIELSGDATYRGGRRPRSCHISLSDSDDDDNVDDDDGECGRYNRVSSAIPNGLRNLSSEAIPISPETSIPLRPTFDESNGAGNIEVSMLNSTVPGVQIVIDSTECASPSHTASLNASPLLPRSLDASPRRSSFRRDSDLVRCAARKLRQQLQTRREQRSSRSDVHHDDETASSSRGSLTLDDDLSRSRSQSPSHNRRGSAVAENELPLRRSRSGSARSLRTLLAELSCDLISSGRDEHETYYSSTESSSTASRPHPQRRSVDLPRTGGGGMVDTVHSASLPASPVHKHLRRSRRKQQELSLVNSPRRRRIKRLQTDSSDDETHAASADDIANTNSYKNLETFQKAQFNKKLNQRNMMPHASRSRAQQYIMHNKAPLWNENSQVYQLDFGGRVTQESAKNFQIELHNKQVMQFGRIDGNVYTLDFQFPFSALQAFAVALANVTQRLK